MVPAGSDLGGQPLSLQAALYGALTSNPDLVTLRQGMSTGPSAEAVEVARHFPTTLNPTLWVDYRPITLIPPDTFGSMSPAGGGNPSGGTPGSRAGHHGFYHSGQNYLYVSLRQPIELGHQTTHRYSIARAALDQQRWTVVLAETTALIQTYRFFQTAAYRRERLRVANDLAEFNDRMLKSLQRRLEANQALPSDVVLARVESRASHQLVKAAQQDYVNALTDLRNQVGIPETAGAAEPLGEFTLPPYVLPLDEQGLIQMALENRPEIHAAQAQLTGAQAAVRLAKGDRIPSQVFGPEWEIDEAGVQYVGLVWITPVPIFNNGTPLLHQRQAEAHRAFVAVQQAQQRAVSQVRAAIKKWNGAMELVNESKGLTKELASEVVNLERLFEQGQTTLTTLMQARQRLIQLETAEVDATWQATQAQADLLLALGARALIDETVSQAEAAAAATRPSQPSP